MFWFPLCVDTRFRVEDFFSDIWSTGEEDFREDILTETLEYVFRVPVGPAWGGVELQPQFNYAG